MTKASIERRSDGIVIVEAPFASTAGGVSMFLLGPSPEEIAEAVREVEALVEDEEREWKARAS